MAKLFLLLRFQNYLSPNQSVPTPHGVSTNTRPANVIKSIWLDRHRLLDKDDVGDYGSGHNDGDYKYSIWMNAWPNTSQMVLSKPIYLFMTKLSTFSFHILLYCRCFPFLSYICIFFFFVFVDGRPVATTKTRKKTSVVNLDGWGGKNDRKMSCNEKYMKLKETEKKTHHIFIECLHKSVAIS